MRRILTNGEILVINQQSETDRLHLIVEDDGAVRAISSDELKEREENG